MLDSRAASRQQCRAVVEVVNRIDVAAKRDGRVVIERSSVGFFGSL